MTDQIEAFTNRYAALTDGTIQLSIKLDRSVYKLAATLSDESMWVFDESEAEVFEGLARIEAGKTSHAQERQIWQNLEEAIAAARHLILQLNLISGDQPKLTAT